MKNNKRSYFVHIPKTAGNSVRKSLSQGNLLVNPGRVKSEREHHFGHRNALRVVNSHLSFTTDRFPCYLDDSKYLDAGFSFTVIRNPFRLLLSYYSHYVDNTLKKNWIDNGWANVNGYHNIKDFNQFIDLYTSIEDELWHVPDLCSNLFGQIFSDSGRVLVDYAIFTERLGEGIEEIGHKSTGKKISLSLGNHNKSPRPKGKTSDFYTQEMIKKVSKKCEWEIDTFKYSVDSNSGLNQSIVDLKNIIPNKQ